MKQHFTKLCCAEPHTSVAVVAICTLRDVIKASKVGTVQELHKVLQDTQSDILGTDTAVASVRSACELFLRFITLTALDHTDFGECKRVLLERADLFLCRVGNLRADIARRVLPFLQDGARILVHPRSRTVLDALRHAVLAGRSFTCLVMEAHPGKEGKEMQRELQEMKIHTRFGAGCGSGCGHGTGGFGAIGSGSDIGERRRGQQSGHIYFRVVCQGTQHTCVCAS